jgi:hypothetical protein
MPNYRAMRNTNILHAPGLKWHPSGAVRVSVKLPDARVLDVMVPANDVRYAIRESSAEVGFEIPEYVGDVELIGWFGSKLWKKAKKAVKHVVKKAKHAVKKAAHGVAKGASYVARKAKKVAKKVIRKVKKIAWKGAFIWKAAAKYAGKPMLRWGVKLAQSKEFGALIAATAIACPAIGGPAMAAYLIANRAAAAYKTGGAAAKTVATNVKRLAAGKNPTLDQKLLKSALRSVAA